MRVKGGMSLRNGIIILAEWYDYTECNFLKINYTKDARQFLREAALLVKRTQPGPPNVQEYPTEPLFKIPARQS